MNNYYNNNKPLYGQPNYGANNYQGNFYQNQGMRPNNNYLNNNQNSNFYNQQNNTQNNQNNYNKNDPNVFISGRIGRILISSEDLNTFSNSIKTVEWTKNQYYLQAKNIEVAPTFSKNSNNENNNFNIPKSNLDEYIINSNSTENDFQNYIREIQDRKNKQNDEIQNEKNEFLKVNFPNEYPGMSVEEIYGKIGGNIKEVVSKDQNLNSMVERYLPYIRPSNNIMGGGNKNYVNTPGGAATPAGYGY